MSSGQYSTGTPPLEESGAFGRKCSSHCITLFLRKTSRESFNLERKSYLDCSSDTLRTRGEFGRVTYWLQTLRCWKRWTHQESTLQDSNAKEVKIPKENGKFIFPGADGRIKLPGGDQELRTPTRDFLGESEGSLPPPQDSLPDAGEAINDFLVHARKLHIPPSR